MAISQGEIRVFDNEDNRQQVIERFCQPCLTKKQKVRALYYCVECTQYQCLDCSSVHNLFPSLACHDRVKADMADPEIESYMKKLETCSEHDKLYEFICEDHDLLCCSNCAIADHRTCNKITELRKKSASAPENRDRIKHCLKTAVDRAENLKKHYLELKSDIQKQIKENEAHFEATRKCLIQKLNKTREKLEQEMSLLKVEIDLDVNAKQKIGEDLFASAGENLKMIESAVRHRNKVQNYICLHEATRHRIPDILLGLSVKKMKSSNLQ